MRKIFLLLILLGTVAPLFAVTWSEPVPRPKSTPITPKIDAYQPPEEESFRQILRKAENGDAVAQFNLGMCYLNGLRVNKNKEEAVKWLKKASFQGNADAVEMMLRIYKPQSDVATTPTTKAAGQEANDEQNLKNTEEKNEAAAERRLKQADEEREAAWRALKDVENNLPSPMAIMSGGMNRARGNHEEMVRIAQAKSEAATERWHQAKDAVEPYRIARQAEEREREDQRQQQQLENLKNLVTDSAKRASDIAKKQASEVSDPDTGKDGGPSTLQVMKLANGTKSDSSEESAQVMMSGIIEGILGVKVKEIRRGDVLSSLISARIPTGTKVFPIRLVVTGPSGDTFNQDMYYYKDEFGDWASVKKN